MRQVVKRFRFGFDLSQVMVASMGSMLKAIQRCDIHFPRLSQHDFNTWLMRRIGVSAQRIGDIVAGKRAIFDST
jgi:hypothetical protein